ncbi:hypothetical protein PCANC_16949 [Puccinia coronata f. sp. avenae]|uniref:Uncharacterized protein n=1 Tax=Puccinia coronata f. sp. avenae TaxID=200324 RepID=A0A2N5V5M3_9BASI|nr:hypothetical protein PCANC_16949 [Puccinia coronata f. sp. avenae]
MSHECDCLGHVGLQIAIFSFHAIHHQCPAPLSWDNLMAEPGIGLAIEFEQLNGQVHPSSGTNLMAKRSHQDVPTLLG